jgi:preprotein translocase subunit YajC
MVSWQLGFPPAKARGVVRLPAAAPTVANAVGEFARRGAGRHCFRQVSGYSPRPFRGRTPPSSLAPLASRYDKKRSLMKLVPEALAQAEQTPSPTAPAPTAPASPTPAEPQSGQATTAQPDAPPSPSLPDLFAQIVPIVVVMGIVYLIVMRPRARREKEKLAQLRNVRRGDTLVTSSGIIAKVTKAIDDAEVEVEIAPNVRIRILRTAIAEVRAKGEPVKDQPAASKS